MGKLELFINDRLYEKLLSEGKDVSPGDLFFYTIDTKGEISGWEFLLKSGELPKDKKNYEWRSANLEYAYATIVNMDFTEHLIKIRIGEKDDKDSKIIIYMPRGVQIWEKNRQKVVAAKMEDLNIGDTVLATGNVRHVCLTVVRD